MLFAGKGVPALLRPQHGSPPLSEADASPSEPSTPDSRSRGAWLGLLKGNTKALFCNRPAVCRLLLLHVSMFLCAVSVVALT